MNMKRVLNLIALVLLFVFVERMYAFVYDVEPLTAVEHYEVEREVYTHDPSNYGTEFMSFGEWLERNEQAESRMHEWIGNIRAELGEMSVQLFDPWYDYRDTREGHGATAPPDWNRGERD